MAIWRITVPQFAERSRLPKRVALGLWVKGDSRRLTVGIKDSAYKAIDSAIEGPEDGLRGGREGSPVLQVCDNKK